MKTDIGILREQIGQRKRFILSWKVRENEFCRVVGTMCKHSAVADVDAIFDVLLSVDVCFWY